MNIGEQFIQAFESLSGNKLRSGLTMLGIVIGVAAVISMLAIGAGTQASITNSINSIGTNVLFLSGGGRGVQNPRPLTSLDAQALANPANAPSVQQVASVVSGRLTITANSQTETIEVSGVTAAYGSIRNLTVAEGEFISEAHNTNRSNVAVIGSTTADNLFSRHTNVIGQSIRISGMPFNVIGVLESKGGGGFGSQDDVVMIPFNTGSIRFFHRSPSNRVDQILVQATSADTVAAATEEVTAIMRSRHRIKGDTNDFSILAQQDILNTAQTITGTLTVFLGGIAAISLLVGGIGIMNIMLVSVTERTREIGLRKALGARKGDILMQFLVESSTLSLLGGVVGILVAWGISNVVSTVAANSGTALNPIIGLSSVLLATLFSLAVGLFFGIYPANRASNLEPVEALRSE